MLNEISPEGRRDITRMSEDDYKEVRSFLADFIKYAQYNFENEASVNKITTVKLTNLMQKLHGDASKTTVLSSNDRTVQTRADSFGDDPDKEVPMGDFNSQIYDAILGAIHEKERLRSQSGYIARVRDFLSKSGEKFVSELVTNSNAFNRAVANHAGSGSAVRDDMNSKDVKAKAMDYNAFVFLMSIEVKQSRGKKSWDEYVNPKKLSDVKRSFGLSEVDQQAAYDTLKYMGFIERSPETGKFTLNRNKVEEFKSRLIKTLNDITEGGLKFSSPTGGIGERTTAKKYIKMKELVDRYIPAELNKAAERRAYSALLNMANKKSNPEVLSVLKAYQNRKEETGERGVSFSDTSVKLVDPAVERVKLKFIASQLSNILTSKKVDVNLVADYSTLVRSIKQRSKNFR